MLGANSATLIITFLGILDYSEPGPKGCFKSKFWLWKEFIIDSRFALRVAEIAPNWPKEVIKRPKYE